MSDRVTASRLAEELGGLARLDVAGAAVPLTSVAVYDRPGLAERREPGAIVLAIGIGPDGDAALTATQWAGEAGAACIVFEGEAPAPPALLDAAASTGLSVITIDAGVDWSQLLALLQNAIASDSEGRPQDVTAVPAGDLFALANAIAAGAGGPSVIEDPAGRVLAYSTLDQPVDELRRASILGRVEPEPVVSYMSRTGVLRALQRTDDVVDVPGEPALGLRPRKAIAIRSGSEHLGSVWVVEGATALGPDADEVLRSAARITPLHLIRHRAGADLLRWTRRHLLQDLLEGRGDPASIDHGLDVASRGAYVVVALDPVAHQPQDTATTRERVLSAVTMFWEAYRRRTAATAIGSTVYVLVPVDSQLSGQRLKATLAELLSHVERSVGIVLRAGIGAVVTQAAEIYGSRLEADQVLRALATMPTPPTVADLSAVVPQVMLQELQTIAADRPELRSWKLQLLADHDAEHSSSYVFSLRAYLEQFGDIPAAARQVSVHPKTFRYRLRRIGEISGLDLTDPNERMALQLELRTFPR